MSVTTYSWDYNNSGDYDDDKPYDGMWADDGLNFGAQIETISINAETS